MVQAHLVAGAYAESAVPLHLPSLSAFQCPVLSSASRDQLSIAESRIGIHPAEFTHAELDCNRECLSPVDAPDSRARAARPQQRLNVGL